MIKDGPPATAKPSPFCDEIPSLLAQGIRQARAMLTGQAGMSRTHFLNSVPGFTDPAVRPHHGSLDAVVTSGIVSPH
jgi:hypothetical protein